MKTDEKLGKEIHQLLQQRGIETPLLPKLGTVWLNEEQRKQQIQEHFSSIMQLLGLDLQDDSLNGTPQRVAKMFVQEIFSGLDYTNFPAMTLINNKMSYDEMVVEKNIAVKSICEHHFLAIDGEATVAYMPNKKVVGLSKLNRIVQFFSRRPQVQERLTEQVHATLCHLLETQNVAVVINAVHFCIKHRGIEDSNSLTITSKLSGRFKTDPLTRSEFMSLSRPV